MMERICYRKLRKYKFQLMDDYVITIDIEPEQSIEKPVCRHAITSEWSPKIESAWVASARADTCMQYDVSSPAILYMLGIINNRPWLAVNVVVSAPVCKAP